MTGQENIHTLTSELLLTDALKENKLRRVWHSQVPSGVMPPLRILISVSVTKEEEQNLTAQAMEENEGETGL